MNNTTSDVLIIGAGPVGVTLALDLARRGVDVVIVEQRGRDEEPRKRCNHIAARTLEIFRNLGIVAEIRNAGLPGDFPQDVAYVTSLTGYELSRIPIPPRDQVYGSVGYSDSGWPTAEPPHRCNQLYWEPVLQRHVLQSPRITILYDTVVEAVDQDENGVSAVGRSLVTGEPLSFEAAYLVGCDGGASRVRKAIGARFEGQSVISGTRSVYIRSTDVNALRTVGAAWMTWFVNPHAFGCTVAMNGTDLWGFHFFLPAGPPAFDRVDPVQGVKAAMGKDFDFEIVSVDDWFGRRLVADRFHDRRIFICGDAAHIWIPMAGYGMNAGIADAMNLSWMLGAVINGWGEPGLLQAYEAERQPVTEQVSKQVMQIALENLDTDFVRNVPAELLAEGPQGEALRAEVGRVMYDANVGQFACLGLNFGTFYDRSPIVAYDGEKAPAYGLSSYTPTTVPGCRTPHVWLDDGTSLYDAMGPGYTLLRFDPSIDVAALQAAAASRGVPLDLLDLSSSEASDIYRHKLVLSRPDQHIAWRGNAPPEDPVALVDLIRGAARGTVPSGLEIRLSRGT